MGGIRDVPQNIAVRHKLQLPKHNGNSDWQKRNAPDADAKSDSPLHSASIGVNVIISSEKMAAVTHVECSVAARCHLT